MFLGPDQSRKHDVIFYDHSETERSSSLRFLLGLRFHSLHCFHRQYRFHEFVTTLRFFIQIKIKDITLKTRIDKVTAKIYCLRSQLTPKNIIADFAAAECNYRLFSLSSFTKNIWMKDLNIQNASFHTPQQRFKV